MNVDELEQNCETCTGLCRSIYHGISHVVSPAAQRKTKYMIFGGGRAYKSHFRVHGSDAECEEDTFRIEFFSDTNHATWPWSMLLPGPILPSRTDDTQCFDQILKWLENCRRNHQHCRLATNPLNARIRVLELSGADVRLVEDFDVSGDFAALSHCWGDALHLVTTKDSLRRHMQSIPWNQLPQTFRDAIGVCRPLQIRFLWIDSLCIVQDDLHDWAIEAAKMQDVYKCAEIVLAATAAANSSEGFFRDRVQPAKVSGPSGCPSEAPISVFARETIEHSHYTVAVSEPAERDPLTTRAWCLQEWLLARRLIHFSSPELVWDCRQQALCECKTLDLQSQTSDPSFDGGIRVLRDRLSQILTNPHSPNVEVLKCVRLWMAIVEEYTAREMTRPTDRMVAISGLAKELTGIAALQPYHAGLLHGEIARQLLWNRKDTTRPKSRSDSVVAPSWSWGSISEPVESTSLWSVSSISIDACEIGDCAEIAMLNESEHQFQPAFRQTLLLATQSLQGTVQSQATIDFGECLAIVNVPSPPAQHEIFFSIDVDLSELLSADVQVVFVKLVTFETPPGSTEGSLCGSLVLLPLTDPPNHYTRIGVVLGDIPDSWYPSERTTEFYIT